MSRAQMDIAKVQGNSFCSVFLEAIDRRMQLTADVEPLETRMEKVPCWKYEREVATLPLPFDNRLISREERFQLPENFF